MSCCFVLFIIGAAVVIFEINAIGVHLEIRFLGIYSQKQKFQFLYSIFNQ